MISVQAGENQNAYQSMKLKLQDFPDFRLPDPLLGFLRYVKKGNVLFFSFFHVASRPYFALLGA
jgi:hypothetical protein